MAPAEGLSDPAPRARGPPSQFPGRDGRDSDLARWDPAGERGRSPPDPPGSPLPGVRGARCRPSPGRGGARSDVPPSLSPPPGRISASASSPAPGAPRPRSRPRQTPPHPPFKGSGCGCKRDPPPSPFSSIKPLGAASGATEPPLPRRPLLQSPGAGGGHPREGTAPFPGIGSHDTVPYPKRAPSCTAFSRVRCFTSVLGLDGSSLSRPGDPRSCPPPSSGLRSPSEERGAPQGPLPAGPIRAPGLLREHPAHPWRQRVERALLSPSRSGDTRRAGGILGDSQPGRISASSSIPTEPRDAHARPFPAPRDAQKTGTDPPGSPTGVTTGSLVALCGRRRIILSLPAPPVAPSAPSSSHNPNLDDFGQSGEKS